MRIRKKKFLYVMFLLITVLMFLHSWKVYINPPEKGDDYAKKHHKKQINKPHHPYYPQAPLMVYHGIDTASGNSLAWRYGAKQHLFNLRHGPTTFAVVA